MAPASPNPRLQIDSGFASDILLSTPKRSSSTTRPSDFISFSPSPSVTHILAESPPTSPPTPCVKRLEKREWVFRALEEFPITPLDSTLRKAGDTSQRRSGGKVEGWSLHGDVKMGKMAKRMERRVSKRELQMQRTDSRGRTRAAVKLRGSAGASASASVTVSGERQGESFEEHMLKDDRFEIDGDESEDEDGE